MSALDALSAFAIAAFASLLGVPIIILIAARLGAVDAPDGHRKNQAQPVPLGGGVAIAVAAATGLLVVLSFASPKGLVPTAALWNAAIPSALVLIIVGLLDDVVGLTGIYKLIGQVLSATLLCAAGFRFEDLSLFGTSIPLGDFGIPFSIFFCLGAINAFNLIDGADGLASSIGAIVCLTLGVIAAAQGSVVASLASFAASGALVGFLRYNAPPARVYLGDTGSMLIGWLVAAVAIRCSIKQEAAVALVVPIAICAIPILDAAAALVRRMTTGQSVFTTDRGHLHHALLLRGWTVGQTAAFAAGLTAITCAGAVISFYTRQEFFALAAVLCVVGALIFARVFGHTELALIRSQVRALGGRVYRRLLPVSKVVSPPLDQAVQLQGRRQWSLLWASLCEAAAEQNLASLKLNINIPHLHESFYANWASSAVNSAESAWRISLPLQYGGRPVGRLLISGSKSFNVNADMQQVLDYLEPLESEVARVVEEVEAEAGGLAGRRLSAPRALASEPVVATTEYH
jgi:UDP-GlcNAc:undecaprenyl-phosphate GlcNAc-1-phosphate transferase